ncbi:MAG: bacteriohemerythrin, partial [Gammaproteobacteria bacterium]
YFKWDAELDINVDTMNEQHKILIDIMNDLYDLNANGASKMELASMLDKLESYTRFHFNDEERFMERSGYNDIDRHKIIHNNLLMELHKHITHFNQSHGGLTDEFFYFLRYWLSTHIRHIDRKYGEIEQQLKTAC